jgi:hypothetical protein
MADTPKRDVLDHLRFPFMFMWFFGAYLLYFKGPAANGKQLAFRIAVFGIGLVGSTVVFAIQAARNRRRQGP